MSRIAAKIDLLSQSSMADQVYDWLCDALVDGRYEPGGRLVQERLAEELDVSRMPVREALSRLSREGYVQRVSGRGYVVSDLQIDEMREFYETRQALEPVALRLAFPHYTPQHLSYLRQLDAEGASTFTRDGAAYFESNRQLHLALVAPCPNRTMVRVIGDLLELPVNRLMSRGQAARLREVKAWRDEHTGIIDALVDGDVDRAADLLKAHLAGSGDNG